MNNLPPPIVQWFRSFIPTPLHISRRERLRAVSGALLGIFLTGIISQWAIGLSPDLPLLIAPMGASAVLLFAAPASPLAQPWSLIGGNLVAALVGVTCSQWIGNVSMAAAVAVSVAIGIMLALRCLHPPSGAVALTAVLGGPSIHAEGYSFVLNPVLLNSCALFACALLYHALTRHRYPHAHAAKSVDVQASQTSANMLMRDVLEHVLNEREELLSIDMEDLQDIVEATITRTRQQHLQQVVCSDVMEPETGLAHTTSLPQAWKQLKLSRSKALPVIDEHGRLAGIVTHDDFRRRPRFAFGLKLFSTRGMRARHKTIDGLMQAKTAHVNANAPIERALELFASQTDHPPLPVLDEERRVVGMVSSAKLLTGLYRDRLLHPFPHAAQRSVNDDEV